MCLCLKKKSTKEPNKKESPKREFMDNSFLYNNRYTEEKDPWDDSFIGKDY